MVDDGRKLAEMAPDESLSEPLTTGNPSLKLKINLRDRQAAVRKRHRSSSPTNSSDSSSTYGSTRSSNRSTTNGESNNAKSLLLKRNRGSIDDEPEAEMPPSSDLEDVENSNGTDTTMQTVPEVKKVRIASADIVLPPSVTMQPVEKKPKTPNGSSVILDVDMNADGDESEKIKTEELVVKTLPTSDSPPASPAPVDDGLDDLQLKMDDDSKTEDPGDPPVKTVKRLTREELERLIMEQMVLAIRETGSTGELEKKLEEADKQLSYYRKRTENLQKQVSDLELVVRRFVQQSQSRKQHIAAPVKMTRSVGLQINMNGAHHAHTQNPTPKKAVERSVPPMVTITSRTHATAGTSTMSNTAGGYSSSGSNSSLTSPSRPGLTSPNLTMQAPDIASYVPQQTQPRYRTQRRSEDPPVVIPTAIAKVSPHVNITSSNSQKSINQRIHEQSQQFINNLGLPKNSINITPVHHISTNNGGNMNHRQAATTNSVNNTQQSNTVKAILARARSSTAGAESVGTSHVLQHQQAGNVQQQQSNWQNKPGPRPGTTVNKVTLPGRLPNVIDLTDEDLEKERAAAAAAGRISAIRVNPMRSPPTSQNHNNGGANMAATRGVAMKSTTLNGRPSLAASRTPNNQLNHSNGSHNHKNGGVAMTHPAPLPTTTIIASNPAWKAMPPKPTLDIKRVLNGIVLSWNMNLTQMHADISSFQLFAYQEGSDAPASNGNPWKRVGDVKALPLPMACTLTQFLEGHRYHFSVRAMDVHGRSGPYSEPGTIALS